MENTKVDLQKAASQLVREEVYANVGSLVEFCIKKAFEGRDDDNPLDEDDINLYVDPSNWDDDQLNEYINDTFGVDWKEVTGYPWPTEPSEEEIEKARAYIKENADADYLAAQIERYDYPLADWDAESLYHYLNEELIEEWVDVTGTRFLGRDEISEEETEQVRDYIRDNASPREVYEWWAVSDWLGRQLQGSGDIVIDLGQLTVWGRECTGQAIYMDGNIQEITVELLKARGEL